MGLCGGYAPPWPVGHAADQPVPVFNPVAVVGRDSCSPTTQHHLFHTTVTTCDSLLLGGKDALGFEEDGISRSRWVIGDIIPAKP